MVTFFCGSITRTTFLGGQAKLNNSLTNLNKAAIRLKNKRRGRATQKINIKVEEQNESQELEELDVALEKKRHTGHFCLLNDGDLFVYFRRKEFCTDIFMVGDVSFQ
jgi:hypothetical protein